MYVRSRKVKGNQYFYLVASERVEGKPNPVQRVIQYLGNGRWVALEPKTELRKLTQSFNLTSPMYIQSWGAADRYSLKNNHVYTWLNVIFIGFISLTQFLVPMLLNVLKLVIEEILDQLPPSYSPALYERKCFDVYQHVYDSYYGQSQSIYIQASYVGVNLHRQIKPRTIIRSGV